MRVNMQWIGTYSHPEDAYDGPPSGSGAIDIFTFDIEGNAAAQYFSPNGNGGSNQQPGLPNLPTLPPLPDFGDQQIPSELGGQQNPYGGPGYYYNNPYSGPSSYNPYNPTVYVNPNYNPYNPNPGFNPYQSIYQPTGAPDTSAYLAVAGGSWHDVKNQSQFDISWMTEIQRQHGVQDFLDYGSFSSASSASLRGIYRPLKLTAVNQAELNAYIKATGNIPSTIATQINVLSSSPGGVTSFASLDDYANRNQGENQKTSTYQPPTNPFGYDSFAGTNEGSNSSRNRSYQGTDSSPAEFGGAPTQNPLGYNNGPTTGSPRKSKTLSISLLSNYQTSHTHTTYQHSFL